MTTSDCIQFFGVVVTFCAVLVALFGDYFREMIFGPKISLTFDERSDRCFRKAIVPNDSIQGEYAIYTGNVTRMYYRLKVENTGGLAKNVKVKIDIFNSDEKEIKHFEPSTLRWINGNEKVDLASKEDNNYVNVCSQVIDPDETFSCNMPSLGVTGGGYVKNRIHNRLRLELFDTSPRGIDKDFLLDNYVFKIIVYGDNFKPIPKKYNFIKPSSNTLPGILKPVSQLSNNDR